MKTNKATGKYTPDTYQTPSEVEAAYRAEGRHAEADAYAGKTGEGDVPRVLEGGLNEAFRVIANLNQECEAWKESHNALLKEKDLYAKLLDETEAHRDELLAALYRAGVGFRAIRDNAKPYKTIKAQPIIDSADRENELVTAAIAKAEGSRD